MASSLAQGIYLTAPADGTPTASTIDALAKRCGQPVVEVRKAIATLERRAAHAKQPLYSSSGGGNGQILAITISPAKVGLPPALACLAAAQPATISVDLLFKGKDFGAEDAQHSDYAGIAQLISEVNASFGDPARPWRLATAAEVLAITSVLFDESAWGPNGAKYWTADGLADGNGLLVETKTENQSLRAVLSAVPLTTKAVPLWVRDRRS